jgi:hypothetical protein
MYQVIYLLSNTHTHTRMLLQPQKKKDFGLKRFYFIELKKKEEDEVA